ncbi:MAG TPA: peptidylprolyl isomerase [Mycobacteriales bacterium]|nr:peptidylprolyl isomerase [Mycobacteriales bacterium]
MTDTDYATLNTNYGPIKLQLFSNKAPKTVGNFVELADDKNFYDGTIFHRVIDGFMLQGGDPTGTGRGGPGYQFADEFHPDLAFTKPYLLAMANSGPNTNGSQFFITVSATTWLTNKHTIFGEVADDASRKVVDDIAALPTGSGDRPEKDVTIESVTVERAAQ